MAESAFPATCRLTLSFPTNATQLPTNSKTHKQSIDRESERDGIHYFLLGFGPEGGRSPEEHRGNLYVRPSVHPSVLLGAG